jgi:glutathione reductase (NADPH)
MAKTYDLIVIGTGTAASVVSSRCRSAGWSVAVIDHLPFGGTCALRGCDPKKVLVGAAEAIDHARRMRGKGVAGGEPAIDWPLLIKFKRSFTEPVPKARERDFAEAGIEAYHGRARFRGPRSVEVGGAVLEARFILIAVGATPIHLGIPGEEHLITSTEFLELDALPKRIVLVGGGFIAAEFSHIAARSGAEVIVLEKLERMLTGFDPDLVDQLMEKSRTLGIDVRIATRVVSIEKGTSDYTVHTSANGKNGLMGTDLVVHAAGRAPDLEALDLAAANIEHVSGRLKLNEFLQSVSNSAIYAAGDAASKGPPLTPVASHDGGIVAGNMLEGNRYNPNYLGVPTVTFTIPPLARVGLLEAEAHRQGLKFRVHHENAHDWYTARRVGETTYAFKVLVEEDSQRILGAHLVGPQADEVINLFALAIRHGLTAKDLKMSIFAYPTAASDVSYML